MTSKVIQIAMADHYIFALCEDGSVWKKGINSSPTSAWEPFGP